MSQKSDKFDFFDPAGMVKNLRDTSLDAWAKSMTDFVNTDAYSEATGKMLDTWLTNSQPFRDAMEKIMSQTLANLNMASRDDITRLAERMTNIEVRLDDLDAKLDK